MRDFFLIKHHPRGLTEAYQENSRRTRAPRHTLPACAGCYDDEGVISLRQRVVNGMQSEGRVVSHLTEVIETISSSERFRIPTLLWKRHFFLFLATFRRKEIGVSLHKSC